MPDDSPHAACVLEPHIVPDASAVTWDDEADVIVVGFGGAGVVAALEAREAGADVLAVDRFAGGGATAYSGGVNYAGGTRHQRDAGFEDTPEEMLKYLSLEVTSVSSATLRRFCEQSSEDLEWLEQHGIRYGGNAYVDKTAFPPDGYWLYYSGNEQLPAFSSRARPAPRGHRPVTPGFGGHLHFRKLRDAAIARGVRIQPHSPARRLIVDRAGAVIGVEVNVLPRELWKKHEALYAVVNPWKPLNNRRAERAIRDCRTLEAGASSPRCLRARGGVVLSTGGFIYNLGMMGTHCGLLARNFNGLLRLGSMGCDGSGIALGQSVGGLTGLMDKVYLGRPLAPPEAFLYGIMVNARGERFINEDAYQSLFGDRLAEQPQDGRAVLLLDHEHFWKGVRQSLFPGKGMFWMWGAPALLNMIMGGTRRAGTLARLARRCGLDAAGLQRTVAQLNARIVRGEPDPFGKEASKLAPMTHGPFYAVNVSLNNKYGPTFAFTLGGLLPDEESGAVRSTGGGEIQGLYAAGRSAVGLCSSGYMSGLAIADTVFSGRRAGRHAAASAAVRPLRATTRSGGNRLSAAP